MDIEFTWSPAVFYSGFGALLVIIGAILYGIMEIINDNERLRNQNKELIEALNDKKKN